MCLTSTLAQTTSSFVLLSSEKLLRLPVRLPWDGFLLDSNKIILKLPCESFLKLFYQ